MNTERKAGGGASGRLDGDGVIVRRPGMGQPAVSQLLRVLREAGLVKALKRGAWMHYELNGAAIEARGKTLARERGTARTGP